MTRPGEQAEGNESAAPGEASVLDTEIDAQGPTAPSSDFSPPDPSLARGDLLGRYVVLELLGAGGMGSVYAAYDPMLDRRVALKVLKHASGPEAVRREGHRRLLREAQALAKLNHPNIVSVYDVGELDGQVYIAMEYVAGQDLRHWLAASPRSWREILEVFIEAAGALQAAHDVDIVHRDFKPENVLVSSQGQVLVIDFGIARLYVDAAEAEAGTLVSPTKDGLAGLRDSQLQAPATAAGIALGMPAYMALEQFQCHSEPRTDQFSFAVCLYEALYGQAPYQGKRIAERVENLREERVVPVPDGADVPPWLHEVIRQALRANVEDRFSSMVELLDRLRPARAESRPGDSRLLRIEREHSEDVESKRRVVAGTASAIFVVGVIAVLYAVNSGVVTPYSPHRILLIALALWIGFAALIFRWRAVFLANQYNTKWAHMIMGTATALVIHRALALIASTDPTQILQVDLVVLATCALLSGSLSRLFYILAAVLTLMAALALGYPSLTRALLNGGGILAVVSIWGMWSLKHRHTLKPIAAGESSVDTTLRVEPGAPL